MRRSGVQIPKAAPQSALVSGSSRHRSHPSEVRTRARTRLHPPRAVLGMRPGALVASSRGVRSGRPLKGLWIFRPSWDPGWNVSTEHVNYSSVGDTREC